MKKVFGILLIICMFVLSGCKPALPGATIHINDVTNNSPETYELNILFDDSRTTSTRAFHMKNIGADIATSSRAIVLENMPRTLYKAEVTAYKGDEKVGYGYQNFQASVDADVYITVEHWEKPFALYEKTIEFPLGTVDSITLNITDKSGNRIESLSFNSLSDTTRLNVRDKKVRVENVDASFEWILMKGTNAIAVYTDTITGIAEGKNYKLNSVKFDMSYVAEDATFESRAFDGLTVKVVPDEKLGSTISRFRFEISTASGDTETAERDITSDGIYKLPLTKDRSAIHTVTITPVMQDGTELRNLRKAIKATPNIKLEDITFSGINTDEIYNLELGYSTLEFDILRNPGSYTEFGEGEFTVTEKDIIDYKLEGNHVTVNALKPGKTTLTYTEPVHEKQESITINVAVHKPVLLLKTEGSRIRIGWDYIHPDSRVVLHSQLKDLRPDSKVTIGDDFFGHFMEDITASLKDGYFRTILYKSSQAIYFLEVQFPGTEPVYSDPVEYTTGENNFITIQIPEMKDMEIEFQKSMDISGTIEKDDRIIFTLDPSQNPSIRKIYWMVNNQIAKETVCTADMHPDEFVFSAADDNINLEYGTGIVPQEIVIAVQTADGRLYSKNINLNLNMENIIL